MKSLKLISMNNIRIDKHVILRWGCIVMDSDFHLFYNIKENPLKEDIGFVD